MNPCSKTIRKSINKAYLKIKPVRPDIDGFKSNITRLFNSINEKESEEFHKNILSTFLKDTWYKPTHYINTKGRYDLVIHNGKDSKSTVGVMLEVKKPSNVSEMPRQNNINAKALHELVYYYMQERIIEKNLEIKNIIATNIFEWFIFDAKQF